MPASTARYFAFDFFYAALQTSSGGGTPTIVTTEFLFPNRLQLSGRETTITFEGGGQTKDVYITTGITAEFSPDAINLAGMSIVFGKSAITAGLPTGMAELTWFGDTAQAAGVAAGLIADAHSIRDVAGVEVAKDIRLWIPLGTLTLGGAPGLTTAAKADQMLMRLAAKRTIVDVIGGALPTPPSGGAFYALAEKS